MADKKREWQTPKVVIYGDVKALTLQVKLKALGLGDDFAQNIYTVSGPL